MYPLEFYLGLLLIAAPLSIQVIIYPLARLCFRKVPAFIIWWICFGVNNVLLFLFTVYESTNNLNDEDAFDDIIFMILWVPWYIGVLIWGIVKTVKADAKASKKRYENNTDDTAV